ncbi:MAG: LysE family translocator [Bacteroidia bacterium]
MELTREAIEWFSPLWKGVIAGFMLSMTFGTVFFSLIQTSIKRGLRKGLMVSSGVVISDTLQITIALFGSSFLFGKIEQYDHLLRIIGFAFLVFLGIRAMIRHDSFGNEDVPSTEKKDILYLFKGLMLNSVNPMLLVAWIGVAAYVENMNHYSFGQMLIFFGVVLITMSMVMIGICYFARKLKDVLSDRNIHRLNVVSGILFIIFAVYLVWPVTGLSNL